MGKIFKAGAERSPVRVALYGDPKIGKTRLATDLPWGPIWGEKAVYIAADPTSSDLSAVLVPNRERLLIATLGPEPEQKNYDPLTEAVGYASKDWRKEDPDIGTLIWDTMTLTSTVLLSAISQAQMYTSKESRGMKFGPMAIPQKGDYGATQRAVMFILQFLFNQPLNVIVVFHSELTDADGEGLELIGGPATVGKAGLRPMAGLFENLFRLAIDKKRIPGSIPPQYTYKRIVQTQQSGPWMAGLRSPHATNPIPEVVLTEKTVEFWNAFDEVRGAK